MEEIRVLHARKANLGNGAKTLVPAKMVERVSVVAHAFALPRMKVETAKRVEAVILFLLYLLRYKSFSNLQKTQLLLFITVHQIMF